METGGYDLEYLVHKARWSWLLPREVLYILQNPDPQMIKQQPHQKPTSGSLFLFDKTHVPAFRRDGHNWQKKPNRSCVNEAHEKLKVGHLQALACYYAKGQDNHNFRRRSYWMLDKRNNHIVLVHYRDITEGTTDSASVLEFSDDQSYTLPQGINNISLGNQVTSLSDMHGSYQSLCSPSSIEVNSKVVAGIQQIDLLDNLPAAGNFSPSLEVEMCPYQLLQELEESPRLNDDFGREPSLYGNQKQNIDGTAVLRFDNSIKEFNQGATMQQASLSVLGAAENLEACLEWSPYENNILDSYSILPDPSSLSVLGAAENLEACLEWSPYENNILDSYSILPDPCQADMPLEEDPSLMIRIPEQKFIIREISPQWCFANEITKVIVIGSFCCDPSETMCAMFDDIEVPVQILQDGVICCQAPCNYPGKVSFCITSRNRESCSEVRNFEYRDRSSECSNCINLQQEENRRMEEVKLLVGFVEMLSCGSSLHKGESNNFHIDPLRKQKGYEYQRVYHTEALLTGNGTSFSITDRVLQELLNDKLHQWLATRLPDGANLSCTLSKKERGIIHLVSGLGYEWALKPILNLGIGVNFRDSHGWNALHWAARFGREEMVGALIACGASVGAVTDPTAQDPIGKNPASIADANGHKGLAGYLSELAMTSQFSALTFEAAGFADVLNNTPLQFDSSIERQSSMRQVLEADRNTSEAAALIQNAFRVHSFRKRQQREECAKRVQVEDEYGLTCDEIQGLSAVVLPHSQSKSVAALTIQKYYRGWKRRSHFLTVRGKVVKIQAHVRGYRFRKYYRVIRVVGIMEKIVLRWRRRRVGLRGFKIQGEEDIDENKEEDEDNNIAADFRRMKVDKTTREAVERVRRMIHCREARGQYSRMLQAFRQAKDKLGVSTKQDSLDSLARAFSINQNNNSQAFPLPLHDPADSLDCCEFWANLD